MKTFFLLIYHSMDYKYIILSVKLFSTVYQKARHQLQCVQTTAEYDLQLGNIDIIYHLY